VFHSSDQGSTWSVASTPVVSGVPSAGIFSIVFLNRNDGFVVGGDYQKETEPSANYAWTKDGGKTWALGPQLPGYRSAITVESLSPVILIAVGPSGIDHLSRHDNGWSSETEEGFDAVSINPRLNVGLAVGADGRIAAYHRPPHL